jgi:hypothetical protein
METLCAEGQSLELVAPFKPLNETGKKTGVTPVFFSAPLFAA